MSGNIGAGLSQLKDLFKKKLKSVQNINLISASAADIYKVFSISGFDYKGQLSSAYGEAGKQVEVSGSVDFGDLIFPGVFTAQIKTGAKITRSSRVLVIVQRFPQQTYPNTATDQTKDSDPSAIWETSEPICLMAMNGSLTQAEASLSSELGAGLPSSFDELGISLGASISAGGSLGGYFIRLTDVSPSSYPSQIDEKIKKYSQFQEDLATLLAGPDKAKVKEEVHEWLIDKSQEWIHKKPKLSLGSKIRAALGMKITTKQLLANLEEIEKGINSPADRYPPDTDEQDLQQIEVYIRLLKKFQAATSDVPTTQSKLCYFQLFSFGGLAEAGSKVSAGLGGSDEKKISDPSSLIKFNTEASVSIKGQAQVVSYRYQSFAENGRIPLVQTQDTCITYRQVDAEAAVKASLSELEKGGSKSANYNSMTYQSAIAYWNYPSVAPEENKIIPVKGSGICFGLSINLDRLIKNHANSESSILKAIKKQLRLDNDQIIIKFLEKAELSSIDPDQDGFPKTVFIESSFAFPAEMALMGREKGKKEVTYFDLEDIFKQKAISEFITQIGDGKEEQSSSFPVLEALRLRFRISDLVENANSLINLGFTAGVGFEFKLSRVEGAGHEGFFDYYVHWYNNDEYNNDPEKAIEAQELGVPPVVLMHMAKPDEKGGKDE